MGRAQSDEMILETPMVTALWTLGRAGVFASCADHELETRNRLVSLEHIVAGQRSVLHDHTLWAVGRLAEV